MAGIRIASKQAGHSFLVESPWPLSSAWLDTPMPMFYRMPSPMPYSVRWRSVILECSFLEHVLGLTVARGYHIANVDSTVILERPKLKDYRLQIRQSLADVLHLPLNCLSVKFKTAERVGPVGEGKSCEAHAVVVLLNP
jgi:hypothetical protein